MFRKLFIPVDNAPLILFRMFFGLLLAVETIGAIFTGWIKDNLIDPEVKLPYIGMEWLEPLPGNGMYFYFAIMGLSGLFIMAGFRYRISTAIFLIMWSGVYFMQKAAYNNHYYLLLLISLVMFFLPANKSYAVDARIKPSIRSHTMPKWVLMVMIFQIAIVYFFAAASKFYPDWTAGTFIRIAFENTVHQPLLKKLFTHHLFHIFLAWSGIFFDLFIVPLLLWKRTRTIALIASVFFHLFNAAFLRIGIFPFFALSFVVFFYPPEKIRNIFFKKRIPIQETLQGSAGKSILLYFFIPYFIIQLLLPIRHYFIKGDVLWTEEGHRLSWRMMLRSRHGQTAFRVLDHETGRMGGYDFPKKLTQKQYAFVTSKPDGIWQMAQLIKKEFDLRGKKVSIYVDSKVSINEKPYQTFINPQTDFATAEWDYFFHNQWILLYDDNGKITR